MLLILFAFWLLLNGRWTVEIAVTGAVICILLYIFIVCFFGYTPKKEWKIIRRAGKLAGYLCWLVAEIFRSAVKTMRLIWSPKEIPVPHLAAFDTRLRTDPGKVLLANSITMTPGTITVSADGSKYLVHCLDEIFAEGLSDSEMERRISEIEENGGKGK